MWGKLTIGDVLKKFTKEFQMRFSKDLKTYIILSQETEPVPIVAINRILELTNELIPEYLKNKYTTIIRSGRKREIVLLRQCFTAIAVYHGHPRNAVKNVLQGDHSTIIHSLHVIRNALRDPKFNPELISIYQSISKSVKQENARLFQINYLEQLDTESNIYAILNPRSHSPTTNKCQYGIKSADTGLGEPSEYYPHLKKHAIFAAD